jgi:hypothetical protein
VNSEAANVNRRLQDVVRRCQLMFGGFWGKC